MKHLPTNRVVLLAIICVSLLVFGCSGKVELKPADIEMVCRNVGYNAAYWPLKNNPDYIAKVEPPLDIAISAAENRNVDIAKLVGQIISFAGEFLDNPEFKDYAGPAKEALRSFEGIVKIDITVPENRENVILWTKAFLAGAKAAVGDLK